MQTTDNGTYHEVDGRPAVRFERLYPHPVERVWEAVTDPAEMGHWDPPHAFAFEWQDDELHFTLSEHEDGCRLVLVNLLSTSGSGVRNAAGWEMCLGHLDRVVDGTWEPSPTDGSMADFLPVLEKYKGAGFPDDGWLPEEPKNQRA